MIGHGGSPPGSFEGAGGACSRRGFEAMKHRENS